MDKDKVYSYLGHRSKNSILGNVVRNGLNGIGSTILGSLDKNRVSIAQAKVLSTKHGAKFKEDKTAPPGAWYVPDDKEIIISPAARTKQALAHEIGHHNSFKNPKSFNSLHKKHYRFSHSTPHPIHSENDMEVRAEREAWIEGAKISGKPKTLISKLDRKLSLGTYERLNEAQTQAKRMSTHPEYLNSMMKRTGRKLAGAAIGGTAGNLLARKLLAKTKERISSLKSKSNKTDAESKELLKLLKRHSRLVKLATVGGAIGGYALTKKYLTKSID